MSLPHKRALLLTLAFAAAGSPLAPAQGAGTNNVIAGRVVSAPDGRPLAHAMVSLQPSQSTETVATTFSAEDGSFRLPAPPAGKYNLYGEATGHLPACYLQHREVCTGIVTGAGLDTTALTLSLPAGAGISGHVVENGGDPIEHATVTLFREDLAAAPEHVVRDRQTQTDDRGAYDFSGLGPGTYFISATGTPWYAVHPPTETLNTSAPYSTAVDPALDVVYPVTFFPAALSSDEASPVALHGGEQIAADISITPLHGITVTLRLPPGDPGEGRGRHFAVVRSVFGVDQFLPTPVSTSDGRTLQIEGLPPGDFRLQEFRNGPGGVFQSVPITAGGSSAVIDLPAAPPAASVTLQVRSDSGKPLPQNLRVALRVAPRGHDRERLQAEPVDANGAVTFSSVAAGNYRPVVFAPGGTPAVAGLSAGGRPAPDGLLHHTGRETLKAELVVGIAPVAVHGFVKEAGKPVPGTLVVLVPAGADTDPDLFRRDQTDLDGSFALAGVVPGNYILVAIADGWSLPWRDPAALRPYLLRGLPVTVEAKNAPTLRIPGPLTPVSSSRAK